MPYQSDKQRKFMHVALPGIAKRWDNELSGKLAGKPKMNKVYKTGSPVAHKNMALDPTGYVNREANKGKRVQPSTRRSGMAKMAIARAAQRRLSNRQRKAAQRPIRGV